MHGLTASLQQFSAKAAAQQQEQQSQQQQAMLTSVLQPQVSPYASDVLAIQGGNVPVLAEAHWQRVCFARPDNSMLVRICGVCQVVFWAESEKAIYLEEEAHCVSFVLCLLLPLHVRRI